jgi:3-hydroxyisobutyrate dehydrogenase
MESNAMHVGLVGLGQMGRGIARNLAAKGLLSAVWDIDESACADFNVPALHGQDLVDATDAIVCVVPSCEQIADVLAGCIGPDTTIIDLTTSAPEHSTALAADLATRGFEYIDAAMTGGAAGADARTLTLMAGGDAGTIAICASIFDAISDRLFHLGPIGSGHAMKLVHNLILHSSFLATCEGLRLAQRAGLDVNAAVDVLNAGNARSFVTEVRFPRDILSGTLDARSTVSNLQKDLGLAVDFAASLSGPAPYSTLTHDILSAAQDVGHANSDFSHLFGLFEDLAQHLKDNP